MNGARILPLLTCLLLHAANPGQPVDLSLVTLSGKHAHLRDYRAKIVVLNFWATWCGPCKEEMPLMAEMERIYGPKGVTFLGVSLDEKSTRRAIPEFLARFAIEYPTFVGATGDDIARLGLGEAIPATAFLNRDGVVFARVRGEIQKAEMLERLEWALSDHAAPMPQPLVTHLPK